MPGDGPDPTDLAGEPPSDEYLLRRLQTMDPERFEHFVADLWTYLGWDTRVVGEPGDRGIDVIATSERESGERKTQLIQAKRYGPTTTVGSPEVQQYASLRLQEESVDLVTIVTTGEYSQQAEDMAPDLDVILVDGEELLGILTETESYELFAHYFPEIDLAPDAGDGDGDRDDDPDGLLDRVRSLFE